MARTLRSWFLLLCTSLFAAACGGAGSETEAALSDTTATGDTASTASAADLGCICIWDKTPVWTEPDPKTRKWVTAVNQGEKVTCGAEQTASIGGKDRTFYQVSLPGGKSGWAQADFLVKNARPAAVTGKLDIYTRPDLITLTNKAFEPFDIVAIAEVQNDWARVVGKRRGATWMEEGWVKNKHLSSDEKNLAVALFVTRAEAEKDFAKREAAIQRIAENSDLAGSELHNQVLSMLTPTTPEPETEAAPEVYAPADTADAADLD